MLKGKCKEDFNKWFNKQNPYNSTFQMGVYGFSRLPFSMQYGVYVDFFRENGKIWIEILSYTHSDHWIKLLGEDIMSPFYVEDDFEIDGTYDEARQKAIEKAVETYNSK